MSQTASLFIGSGILVALLACAGGFVFTNVAEGDWRLFAAITATCVVLMSVIFGAALMVGYGVEGCLRFRECR